MRYVIFWTAALTLLFHATARAEDSYSFRGGPALMNGSPTGTAKYFALRNETHQIRGVYSAVEGGGWVDRVGGGRKSSAVGKAQVGINPGSEKGVYGKAFLGIAALSHTDSLLGGHGQFTQDFGVGFRDYYTAFDVTYSHFSSAGLAKPNRGRDWILFSVGVRW